MFLKRLVSRFAGLDHRLKGSLSAQPVATVSNSFCRISLNATVRLGNQRTQQQITRHFTQRRAVDRRPGCRSCAAGPARLRTRLRAGRAGRTARVGMQSQGMGFTAESAKGAECATRWDEQNIREARIGKTRVFRVSRGWSCVLVGSGGRAAPVEGERDEPGHRKLDNAGFERNACRVDGAIRWKVDTRHLTRQRLSS